MSTTLILACLFCFVLGAVLGFLLTRTLHPREQQRKELEQQLEKTRDELKQYQQAVTSHFLETSSKVNSLTESYRSLHEHLASGAMHLASPEISRQLIEAGYGKLGAPAGGYGETSDSIEPAPQPPKDYAPDNGVLSEDYGLKDEKPGTIQFPGNMGSNFDTDESDPTLKTG